MDKKVWRIAVLILLIIVFAGVADIRHGSGRESGLLHPGETRGAPPCSRMSRGRSRMRIFFPGAIIPIWPWNSRMSAGRSMTDIR